MKMIFNKEVNEMPGFDGTGPRGLGAMTVGGCGNCITQVDGISRFPRFGRPGGCRGGRGWRNKYYATGMTGWQRSGFTPEQENKKK